MPVRCQVKRWKAVQKRVFGRSIERSCSMDQLLVFLQSEWPEEFENVQNGHVTVEDLRNVLCDYGFNEAAGAAVSATEGACV
jgi:hypothetical protein